MAEGVPQLLCSLEEETLWIHATLKKRILPLLLALSIVDAYSLV